MRDRVKSPSRVRESERDVPHPVYKVLSHAEVATQHQEVDHILLRIKEHAKSLAENKPWGAPTPTPTQSHRSFSSPLKSPTLRAHKAVLTQHVLGDTAGRLPPTALLAPEPAALPPSTAPPPGGKRSTRERSAKAEATRKAVAARGPPAQPSGSATGGSRKPVAQLEAEINDLRSTVELLLATRASAEARRGGTAGAATRQRPGQPPPRPATAAASASAAAGLGGPSPAALGGPLEQRMQRVMLEHHGNMQVRAARARVRAA